MGIRLVEEVMDHAPDTLTTGEWKGLVVLARDANDRTRLTYNGVNSPEILRRVRLSVPAWANLRSALIRKGVLEVATAGVKGRSAVYRIPPLAPAILHPVDEESSTGAADLHLSDEASEPTPRPVDEESPGFLIQQMTPTPLSTHQEPLSPQRSGLTQVDAPDPTRERSASTNNTPAPAQTVLDAYAAALGRPVTNGARTKLLDHATSLLDAGYPAAWLADRAREMAPKGWTDLEQHAARSTIPLPGARQASDGSPAGWPAWCGHCNQQTRLREDPDTHLPNGRCPSCHPLTSTPTQQPAPRGHQPWRNPTDQSVYYQPIS